MILEAKASLHNRLRPPEQLAIISATPHDLTNVSNYSGNNRQHEQQQHYVMLYIMLLS
jgi:hypothetical protein